MLVDAQGKIAYDAEGMDEDELRKEIAKLGQEYASLYRSLTVLFVFNYIICRRLFSMSNDYAGVTKPTELACPHSCPYEMRQIYSCSSGLDLPLVSSKNKTTRPETGLSVSAHRLAKF
jgi:hypothetical protein